MAFAEGILSAWLFPLKCRAFEWNEQCFFFESFYNRIFIYENRSIFEIYIRFFGFIVASDCFSFIFAFAVNLLKCFSFAALANNLHFIYFNSPLTREQHQRPHKGDAFNVLGSLIERHIGIRNVLTGLYFFLMRKLECWRWC